VAEHNTLDDCWIVVGEKAYEIPEAWTKSHPGGYLPLKAMAGKDATDAFE
jgi:cytochrome b involved in lipid metabolism